MSKKLIEVATEFGLGTKTIVEFLKTNSFEVIDNPKQKVSDEMYESLAKHYQKNKEIKNTADEFTGNRKKEETEKVKEWEKPSNFAENKNSALVKQIEELKQQQKDQPAPVTKPQDNKEQNNTISTKTDAQKTEAQKFKIVGKIDLDNNKKSENRDNKRDDRNKTDNRNNDNRNKNDNRNNDNRNKNTDNRNNDNRNKNTDNRKQNIEPRKVVSEIPEVKPEPQENKIETANTEIIIDDNSYRAETPTLQGLKILGKIDLSKPKPVASSNKDKPQEHKNDRDRNNRNKTGENRKSTTENRDGNTENRDGNTEYRKPKTETRDGNTENRKPKTENRDGNTENRKPKTETRDGNNENRKPKTENRDGKTIDKVIVPPNQTDPNNTSTYFRRKDSNATPNTQQRSTGTNNNTGQNNTRSQGAGQRTTTNPTQNNSNNRNGNNRNGNNRNSKDFNQSPFVVAAPKRTKTGKTRSERADKKELQRIQSEEVEEQKPLQVTEFISVSELANLMSVGVTDIITTCMSLGIFVSINQRLDTDVIELVASEYNFTVEFISAEQQMDMEDIDEEDAEEDLKPRSPIVTVMGHVDHGKTSLLDYIRKANVASGEAGGITQHIGAYEVVVPNSGKITFLDTPGHEAFTAMRARGAKVTDIAIIIVAADDNIMPQTKEAISHAQAANVPMIFAINKIDKEGADPERIKGELAQMNLLVEDWGGKYQSQDISAKKGLNVNLLLEKVLLEAEMLNLRGNPDRKAIGTVLEASLEKGRGYVSKILIQTGSLKVGDPIVAGQYSGKVKAMFNERGKNVKIAGPATPVLVLGLEGAPQAGEKLKVMPSERESKELAAKRAQIARQQQIRTTKRMTLDEIARRLKIGNFKELNLIIKGDMDGSVEALSDSLLKLSNEQVQTRIVYKAVGPITESDVNLALASDAIIVGFQVRPNNTAKKLAEQEGVQIKMYSIIYDAIGEIKSALEGLLQPKQVEQELGMVEIRQVFEITKIGKVAGCFVQEGKITRNSFVRVIRSGIVVFPTKENTQGELASLKRIKDNAAEVKAGFECGLTIKNFDNIQEGDIIEAYEIIEVKQKMDDFKKTSAQ